MDSWMMTGWWWWTKAGILGSNFAGGGGLVAGVVCVEAGERSRSHPRRKEDGGMSKIMEEERY